MLDGKPTAFECDHWSASDIANDYSDIDLGGVWRFALAFRWGADLSALRAAYLAASAYAAATGGVILDCEEGKIISTDRAAEIAFEVEQQAPLIEEAMHRFVASYKKES